MASVASIAAQRKNLHMPVNHRYAQLRKKSQLRIIERFEKSLKVMVQKAYQRLSLSELGEKALEAFDKEVEDAIFVNSFAVYVDYAMNWRESFVAANPHVLNRKFDSLAEARKRAAAIAKKNSANKIKRISKTVREDIRNIIAKAARREDSPAEVAKKIRDEVKGIGKSRSETIARTEIHSTAMTSQYDASIEAQKEFDIKMEKVWISSEDDRTRESHVAANDQQVPFDKPFIVGGEELMFPGDPDGDAGEIINCRCTWIEIPL